MAVYTEVSDEDMIAFLAQYDVGTLLAYKGIAEGVENSNYLVQTDRASYILTLYEKRVDPDDLPYFLSLMEHLAARGVPAPTPLHGRDGAALRRLCDRPAAVISFLPGLSPKRLQPFHCGALGDAMARLHIAGADFPGHRPNALGETDWRPLYESCGATGADQVQPGLAALIEEELDVLDAHWPTGLPAGVIHADLFPDNVFFRNRDQVSGIIDYYFACNDLLAYDLAICLNAWCFEPDGSFNITKARQLCAGYHRRRPLGADELAALPLLARGAALRFLLTRLYDWINTPADAFVTKKDPLEYARKLRFHRAVAGPQAYGLDGAAP